MSGTSLVSNGKPWAGYIAVGSSNTVSCVEASWVEPDLKCPATGYSEAMIWSGIEGGDGHGSAGTHQRAESAGTVAWCDAGRGWHEAFTYIQPQKNGWKDSTMVVFPEDRMWSQVRVSGHTFTMTIADLTQNTLTSVRSTIREATLDSAQWMVQTPMPGCPKKCSPEALVPFHSVTFSGVEATIGGVLGLLSHWPHEGVTMQTGSLKRATYSSLSHGNTFTVVWHHL